MVLSTDIRRALFTKIWIGIIFFLFLACQNVSEPGSSLNSTTPHLTLTGSISGHTPAGIHPLVNASVTISPVSDSFYYTNTEGKFEAEFVEIPDTLTFHIAHPNYQSVDTTIVRDQLTQLSSGEYSGAHFTVNQLVDYLPVIKGRHWTFNSEYRRIDLDMYSEWKTEGVEKWDIIEVSPDTSSFQLGITFSGSAIAGEDRLDTTWIDNWKDTLVIQRSDTMWTATESDSKIPGVRLLAYYGLLYQFPYTKGEFTTVRQRGGLEDGYRITLSAKFGVGFREYRIKAWWEMVEWHLQLVLVDSI